MTVANVYCSRTNKYNVEVDAYIEPCFHDNVCKGTKFPQIDTNGFSVEALCGITVAEAIKRGNEYDFPVTIYLYDVESS